MAVLSIKNKIISRSMLVGNAAYIPSAYDSIATVIVGAGGASSVSFTSIPSTYSHLQIRVLGRCDAAGSDRESLSVMMNSDNATNYTSHFLVGNGSTVSSSSLIGVTGSNNQLGGSSVITGSTAPANTFGMSIIDILDYTDTNKYKVTRSLNGQDQNNSSGRLNLISGLWLSTAAITSLTLTVGTGNFISNSVFELYGIRG